MCILEFGEQTIQISSDKRYHSVRVRAYDGSYGVRIDMSSEELQQLIEKLQEALIEIKED